MIKNSQNAIMVFIMAKEVKTSWGGVADWYDELLEGAGGSYQKEVILPNLLRLMEIKPGEKVLDLACGQGFFSREFEKAGAKVTGADVSAELISLAKKRSPEIDFIAAPADKLSFTADGSFDKIAVVLALQNIENISGAVGECARVLKPGGKVFIVMNHPAFRIPKKTGWGWDEKEKIQYRRIDGYMSESKAEVEMHPGKKPGEKTISFHHPLQVYFKIFARNNLCVSRLEEWISDKKSRKGPRSVAEDSARKEIPLFLFLEVLKTQ